MSVHTYIKYICEEVRGQLLYMDSEAQTQVARPVPNVPLPLAIYLCQTCNSLDCGNDRDCILFYC